jgi:CubicO group peptidase (beta-lactamase class C family)
MAKQFVCAAIMMLVEDGKLSLDDSIAKFFPGAPDVWAPISIKNLLSHTSGLSEYKAEDRVGANGPFFLRLDFTEDELLAKIQTLPVEWTPGDEWGYRNTNYVLLGILIRRVTGIPFGDFLNERIFKALGMTSTRIISDRDLVPNRAAGYVMEGEDQKNLKNQNWVSPTFNSTADCGMYFNVLDLAKWDGALYNSRLLKQSSLDRIFTVSLLNNGKPNPLEYGFAWIIGQQNGHKFIHHGGEWQGFRNYIARYPDDGLTVAVLTNLNAVYSTPQVIAHVVAGMIEAPLFPVKIETIADTQPEIAAKLAGTLDRLVSGEDIRPQLSAPLAGLITPERTKHIRHKLLECWPDGQLALVKRETVPDIPGQITSIFRVSKHSGALLIRFDLASDGIISGFGIQSDREYE